ncbi:hypothetical protein ISREJYDI_CDS0061 [Pseudomonas phage UNO-G1W1]|uniref:VWFA domain-containing protein n=1 Tax=Pseudomonas phage UNO-G1W1 TaxID=3136609 RepID=A0AAX4MVP7_9CAUD
MTNPNAVEIIFVIDESASMKRLRGDVIGGFNMIIEDQKKVEGAANVTLITFNSKVTRRLDQVALADVQELTEDSYVPGGMTAMNDAIGSAIAEVLRDDPARAIIHIFTDGEENASVEYNTAQIKALVEEAQGKGYQVVFMAANIDVAKVGGSFGVAKNSMRAFVADSHGLESAYLTASASTHAYRAGGV